MPPAGAAGVSLRHLVIEILERTLIEEDLSRMDISEIIVDGKDCIIGSYERENVESIAESILSNAAKHSNLLLDKIKFCVLRRYKYTYLHIMYASVYREISDEIAMGFGLYPVVQEGRVRYGAFLLGSRVRAAGGVMDVRRPSPGQSGYRPLEVSIVIPLGQP